MTWPAVFAIVGFLIAPASAPAQTPGAPLPAPAANLQIGSNILMANAIPIGREPRTQGRDSLRNGTLIGLGIGLGMGTAWCAGAVADDSGDVDARVECAEGFLVFPAIGALVGLGVDALIPGKTGPAPSHGRSRARVSVMPMYSARMKGVAMSVVF